LQYNQFDIIDAFFFLKARLGDGTRPIPLLLLFSFYFLPSYFGGFLVELNSFSFFIPEPTASVAIIGIPLFFAEDSFLFRV